MGLKLNHGYTLAEVARGFTELAKAADSVIEARSVACLQYVDRGPLGAGVGETRTTVCVPVLAPESCCEGANHALRAANRLEF